MRFQRRLWFARLFLAALLGVILVRNTTLAADQLTLALSNEEAWRKLPTAQKGGGQPLPVWARMMANDLPRTTAALLQLDYAQRTPRSLDPKLRAAMRWVAAHANGCGYTEAYSAADATRAGLSPALLASLTKGDLAGWSESDRLALEFSRKMTVDSDSVTDEEFQSLVKRFGENTAASMVLVMAYANMQDRLMICLGAQVEPDGPFPPIEVSFAPSVLVSKTTPPPPRPKTALPPPKGRDEIVDDPNWSGFTYEQLQKRLANQRAKPTRLRIPAWSEFADQLPQGMFSKASDIVWYRIVFGYARELAIPFEFFMRTAGAETAGKYDRIFGQSVFWVTTRALMCPYCMGHCEMNWEVAGLSPAEISERSKLLAGNDWSSFPPAEQRAFAFARKLTQKPGTVGKDDLSPLIEGFGRERALVLILNTSRYHYMTRISNGFQLRLESENVFYDYYNTKPTASNDSTTHTVTPLSAEECWKRLPAVQTGGGGPLPNWVKYIAVHMPRTAAAMLELDFAQRTKSPINPKLRAKMRYVVAVANHCEYSAATALADLDKAGGASSIKTLVGGPDSWSEEDKEPLQFARELTLSASTISDELFAHLVKRFGEKQVAAMVLLAAYGNFQDRILLGLQVPIESEGPMPPLEIKFAPGALQMTPILPPQGDLPKSNLAGQTVVERDPEWELLSFDGLQARLEFQRARKPRLPIPTWDEVKKNLPPTFAARPTRIVWNLVCSGYVPELAVPWGTATRTMWAELPQDRVFEESLFWIQTRSVKCNYCMGHCEMLLEVAGLDKQAVFDRTKKLASNDWSSFPPAEQRAYAYARKLSKTPWKLTGSDYQTLASDLGPANAMATFWWLCRGLYMTRISDGFALPLERDNVFQDYNPARNGNGVKK